MLIKLVFKKLDKNKDGKIENEEISKEDMKFLQEMLKESFKTIANGLIKENNISSKTAYSIIFENLKRNKNTIKNLEKESKKNVSQNNKQNQKKKKNNKKKIQKNRNKNVKLIHKLYTGYPQVIHKLST